MDWIPALLKHLGLSRSVVGAICVTSLVLFVGPRIAPGYIEPVPKEWAPVVVGALVFSACLLLFWAAASVWAAAQRRWKQTSAMIASLELSQLEVNLLHAMGEMPREPLNLERVNYEGLGLTRLEVLELIHELKRKGLVVFNQFDSDLISLSATGRQRALEIQRNSRQHAT